MLNPPPIRTTSDTAWSILVIDDDEDDFLIARNMLKEAKGRKFDIHWANTFTAGREELISNHYHAVLVDYDLGLHSGIELIREANERGYPAPLILFTGRGSYDVDVEAMQAGATLYLTKGEVNSLLLERAIRYAIELKQKERALLERDRKLSVVLDAAELGTWTYNFDDHSFEMDERAQGFYRANGPLESHDFIVKEFLHPDDIPAMWAALSKAADPTGDGRYQAAYRIVQPDGSACWLNAWGLTEFEGQGADRRAVRLIGASRDLTEQVHSAEALQESEQHLQDTLESITDGFLALDQNWRYTYFNETGARMIGMKREDLIGGCVWELFPHAEKSMFYTGYHQAVETNQPVHFEEYYPEPINKWLECHCYPTKDGLTVYFRDVTERKQAEELLQQSLARAEEGQRTLEALMEYLPEGITIADAPEAIIRMVSRYGQEILGGALEQMTVEQIVDRWKVYDQDGITPLPNDQLPLVRAIQRGEVVKNQDLVQVNTQGQHLYLSCNAGPIRDASGKITGGVVAWREISERKQAEDQLRQVNEALRESEERYRRLVENAHEGVWSIDAQGITNFINPYGAQILGYTVEEMLGRPATDFLFVEDVPKGEQHLEKRRQGIGEYFDIRMRRKDGSPVWVSSSAVPFTGETGEYQGALAMFTDSTGRRQVEEALRGSEQKSREILESISDGFFSLDREWRVTYINPQAGEQGGYRAEDLIGTVIWDSVPQLRGSNLEAIYRKVMEERKPEMTEFHSPRSMKWFRLRVYPSTVGISVYSIDITAEKQAEKELQRYAQELERSNQTLQDFAFVASHDLQEPLRKIIMFGNSLRRHLCDTPDEAVDDKLNRILNAAERMQTMITGLLDLSRISAHSRVYKHVHLTQIVEGVVADLELRIQAVNGQVIIGELPMIEADELQMRQLFQNLIGNAIKFHKPDVPPVVHVSGMVDQTNQPLMVEIRIEDYGIGFDQKDAARVFQPFQRLHGRSEYEGTGLGLAICQKIVERHHGTIEVESAPGKGSTFIIRLPTK